MEFVDENLPRRNIHDDLDQLLEDNGSEERKEAGAAKKGKELESPSKKKVAFTDKGSG